MLQVKLPSAAGTLRRRHRTAPASQRREEIRLGPLELA